MTKRKIIEIDPDLCNGCGSCIAACAEGALALVGGKARLVSDSYCDGLGACIGDCPTGAITVIERQAGAFDADAGRSTVHTGAPRPGDNGGVGVPPPALACGCPGSHEMVLNPEGGPEAPGSGDPDRPSQLSHWPIKLRLLNPAAPYLAGADILLLADCAAAACPNLHERLLKGRCVAMGCPKFDDVDFSVDRLTDIIRTASPASITVAHMEVPCCNGLLAIARRAAAASGMDIPIRRTVLARTGNPVLEEGPTADNGPIRATKAV
jgi:ferredoxin